MNGLRSGLGRYLTDRQLDLLARTRVGIAGAGGLGSNAAFALARSGVRRFTLVDLDRVEASNLNRQAYFPDDVGLPKVRALARHLLTLDPELDLTLHHAAIAAENAPRLFQHCPVVIEALDDPAAKAMLLRTLAPGRFLICASGIAGCGGPPMTTRTFGPNAVIIGDFTTPADAAHPPLAPRVLQAAAMQADAALRHILQGELP